MNRSRLILSAVVLSGALATSALAWGGPGGDRRPGGPGCDSGKRGGGLPIMRELFDLDLTSEQRDQIRDILRSQRKEMRRGYDRPSFEESPMSAMSENGFSKARFIAKSQAQMNKRITDQAEVLDKIYAVLTPKQRQELVKELKEEW